MTEKKRIKDAVTQVRQQQILKAAVEVFSKKGYYRATIKDIAHTAGVADGTIYNYFKNKQDVLLNVAVQMGEITELIDDIDEAVTHMTLPEILEMVFQNRLRALQKNLPTVRAIFPQVMIDAELQSLFHEKLLQPGMEKAEAIFEKYIDENDKVNASPRFIVRALLSVIFGMIMMELLGESVILNEAETFSKQMTTLFLQGLSCDQPEANA